MRATIISLSVFGFLAFACSKAQTDSVALCNKGVMAYKRGDMAMAQGLFERAIALWSKNQIAHYQLGMILLHEKKDFEQAERHLNEALRLNQKDAEVIFQLGRLKLEKGLFDEAMERFQRVLALNPSHVGALYWSGITEQRRGRLSEADELFRKAIKADPFDARAFSALAMMYWENGAESEAMAVLKEAIRINPEDAEAHHSLGLVYMGMDNFKAAVHEFTSALEFDPDDSVAAFNLACALIRLGKFNQASFYLKKFIVEGRKVAPNLVEPAQVIFDRVQRLIAASGES
jgi:tetratricopeptide (TPR) repeat protein